MRDNRRQSAEDVLGKFLQSHGSDVNDSHIHMVTGDPPKALPAFASENGVDLIVTGTVARRGLTGILIGNTAERILDDLECSVLAVKPDSFVPPIKAGEYIDVSRERLNED